LEEKKDGIINREGKRFQSEAMSLTAPVATQLALTRGEKNFADQSRGRVERMGEPKGASGEKDRFAQPRNIRGGEKSP